ncbi:MAG: hypothetical protein QOF09_3160 [Alphaproteobacteria bacterium]|nr:hypothetical protein [Alphaproteobacteria bacterium]
MSPQSARLTLARRNGRGQRVRPGACSLTPAFRILLFRWSWFPFAHAPPCPRPFLGTYRLGSFGTKSLRTYNWNTRRPVYSKNSNGILSEKCRRAPLISTTAWSPLRERPARLFHHRMWCAVTAGSILITRLAWSSMTSGVCGRAMDEFRAAKSRGLKLASGLAGPKKPRALCAASQKHPQIIPNIWRDLPLLRPACRAGRPAF